MNINRKLQSIVLPAKWGLILTVLLMTFGGVLIILQGKFLSSIISDTFIAKKTLSDSYTNLYFLLLIFLIRGIVFWGQELTSTWSAVQVKDYLREKVLQKIIRLGPAVTEQTESGEIVTAAVQGVEDLDGYFSQFLPQVFLSAIMPVLILAFVFPMDILTGVILVITMPLIPIFMWLVGTGSEAATKKQFGALSRMSSFLLDVIKGLSTLKMFGKIREVQEKVNEVSNNYRDVTMRVLKITFLSAFVLEIVATISTAIIAVEIVIRLLNGEINYSEALFLLVIAPEFYLPLRMLATRYHSSQVGVAAAEKIFGFLEIPEKGQLVPSLNNLTFPQIQRLEVYPRILFDKVSFTYPLRSVEILHEVSAILPAGKTTALVGKSGSGKSTIAQLLMKFHPPTTGRILIEQEDLSGIPKEIWYEKVAWVSQTPYFFARSVRDNLLIGNPNANDDELLDACEKAKLMDWLVQQPLKMETQIGERGIKLSSGEAQRLALARALLKNPLFFVLDEPTAHTDPILDHQLHQAIWEMANNRTTLIIAHRLSTILDADQIIVLENGWIIESGTPSDLRKNYGAVSTMIKTYQGK